MIINSINLHFTKFETLSLKHFNDKIKEWDIRFWEHRIVKLLIQEENFWRRKFSMKHKSKLI